MVDIKDIKQAEGVTLATLEPKKEKATNLGEMFRQIGEELGGKKKDAIVVSAVSDSKGPTAAPTATAKQPSTDIGQGK